MAKKIVVNENEDVKVISKVTKLVTRLSNGENCTWVPEDEIRLISKSIIKDGDYIASKDVGAPYGYSQVTVNGIGNKILGQLGEKNITKNGTYIAENDSDGPYYGYSRVIVNVEGGDSGGGSSVVGKDEDGDDAIPRIDDDGHIVTEKLPTRISISVYPNNLVYEDGQAIDFTGLRVKAFLPNDAEWGVVPSNEILTPVTVAANVENDFYFTAHPNSIVETKGTIISTNNGSRTPVVKRNDGKAAYFIGVNVEDPPGSFGGNWLIVFGIGLSSDSVSIINPDNGTGSITIDNITYYYIHSGTNKQYGGGTEIANPLGLPIVSGVPLKMLNVNVSETYIRKWMNILNFKVHGSPPGQQQIPLQWKRPGDGKALETSFTISVHGSSGGDNNASGGNVTPGNQNIDAPQ